jgi:hypothetical protein
MRLSAVIESTYKGYRLTRDDKCELGEILADNMSDFGIINLFEIYVDEPDESNEDSISGKMVRCNMADKYGCTAETCYHAVDHPHAVLVCDDTYCDRYDIDVVCE